MPKRYFSESFKESALDYYKEHGLKETCQRFDVSKWAFLDWRRKAGVESSRSKSRHKYHERRTYNPEYKLQVLRDANLLGPEKAAVKYSINSNLIYSWKTKESDFRDNICSPSKQPSNSEVNKVKCGHSPEFRKNVLSDFHSLGAAKTAEKYKINPCLIYKWKGREKELQQAQAPQDSRDAIKTIKFCKKKMSDYQKEVLDHFVEHGLKLTRKKFAINQARLLSWRKKFDDEYEGKLMQHDGKMLEVVKFANTYGLREATLKYGVSIKTIWEWKAKLRKRESMKKSGGSVKKDSEPRKPIDENQKGEIIETYMKEGAFACEKKYNIPRQTVRNWALNRGTVQVNSKLKLAKDALLSAQENGVQEAVAKFSISRASLYNWAKKFGMNMSETDAKGSITLKVSDGLKERNIVFYKKKVKPVRIKFKAKPEKKPKEKKRMKDDPQSQVLPDWVVEFIKKKVPKIGLDQEQIVLRSNETVFEGEDFTISTVDFAGTSLDPHLEDPLLLPEPSDVSSDQDYECDYVELDLFTSLPFFTPTTDVHSNYK